MDIIEDSPVVKSVQVEQEKVFPSVEAIFWQNIGFW